MHSLRTLLSTTLTLALQTLTSAAISTYTVSLPGSTLDGQEVNAAGTAFYVGGEPATYCPTSVEPNCPPVTGTVFAGISALWVEVPGGQQTYVTSAGAFSFTQAHSIFIPTGSYQYGWTSTTVVSDYGESYNLTNFIAPNATTGGILACPYTPANSNTTSFQIYARTPAFNQTNCVELEGLVEQVRTNNSFGAWQYI